MFTRGFEEVVGSIFHHNQADPIVLTWLDEAVKLKETLTSLNNPLIKVHGALNVSSAFECNHMERYRFRLGMLHEVASKEKRDKEVDRYLNQFPEKLTQLVNQYEVLPTLNDIVGSFKAHEFDNLLIRAVTRKDIKAVRFLLSTELFNPNAPLLDSNELSDEILNELISNGANINVRSVGNSTPLKKAVQCFNLNKVKMLVAANAEIHDELIFDLSISRLDNGKSRKVSFFANRCGILDILLSKGLKIDLVKDHYSLLTYECDNILDTRFIEKLLQCGANPDLQNSKGETALMGVARGNHVSTMKKLIEYKADVNIKDNWGETALHHAVQTHYTDSILVLLKANADLSIKDNRGNTPFAYVQQGGRVYQLLSLYQSISDLKKYSDSLPEKEKKIAQEYEQRIRSSLNAIVSSDSNQIGFGNPNELFSILTDAYHDSRLARQNRWKVLLKNIFLCLTGIGIIFAVGKMIVSGLYNAANSATFVDKNNTKTIYSKPRKEIVLFSGKGLFKKRVETIYKEVNQLRKMCARIG